MGNASTTPKLPSSKPGPWAPYTPSGDTPINIAINNDYPDIASLLIKKNFGINHQLENGDYPLHVAIRSEQYEVTEQLLAQGAQVNVEDRLGLSPLHVACVQNLPSFVELLLKHGAHPEGKKPGKHNHPMGTALKLAVEVKAVRVVELLLKAGANPLVIDTFGKSPVLIAVGRGPSYREVARAILPYIETLMLQLNTEHWHEVLAWAIACGSCEVVPHLLKEYVPVRNAKRAPLILLAIEANCHSCFRNLVQFLGESQLHASSGGCVPLEYAFRRRNFEGTPTKFVSSGVRPRSWTFLSDDRIEFAETLIIKYGVDVKPAWIDCCLHNGGCSAKTVRECMSLCMSAYGGIGRNETRGNTRQNLSKLFDFFGRNEQFDLLIKLYTAGYQPTGGNILELHHNSGDKEATLEIVDRLNETVKTPRTLLNLSVLRIRLSLESNVLYKSKFLSAPALIRDLITIK